MLSEVGGGSPHGRIQRFSERASSEEYREPDHLLELRRTFASTLISRAHLDESLRSQIADALKVETSPSFVRLAFGELPLTTETSDGTAEDVRAAVISYAIGLAPLLKEWRAKGEEPPIEGLW